MSEKIVLVYLNNREIETNNIFSVKLFKCNENVLT